MVKGAIREFAGDAYAWGLSSSCSSLEMRERAPREGIAPGFETSQQRAARQQREATQFLAEEGTLHLGDNSRVLPNLTITELSPKLSNLGSRGGGAARRRVP